MNSDRPHSPRTPVKRLTSPLCPKDLGEAVYLRYEDFHSVADAAAARFATGGTDEAIRDDLRAEARIGILECFKAFGPEAPAPLMHAFARRRIARWIRDVGFGLVRVPHTADRELRAARIQKAGTLSVDAPGRQNPEGHHAPDSWDLLASADPTALPAQPAGPSVAAHRASVAEAVLVAVSRLPKKDRELISAYYLEGKKEEEIAAARGVTKQAVSFGLQKALHRLRLKTPPELAGALRNL